MIDPIRVAWDSLSGIVLPPCVWGGQVESPAPPGANGKSKSAGFRLSLGIAWLVIVAAEMLTGRPGVGGFLWQEYNALIYEHIILCILTIGVVGFVLDRLMSLVEKRFKTA